jgi:hypothetical protein
MRRTLQGQTGSRSNDRYDAVEEAADRVRRAEAVKQNDAFCERMRAAIESGSERAP